MWLCQQDWGKLAKSFPSSASSGPGSHRKAPPTVRVGLPASHNRMKETTCPCERPVAAFYLIPDASKLTSKINHRKNLSKEEKDFYNENFLRRRRKTLNKVSDEKNFHIHGLIWLIWLILWKWPKVIFRFNTTFIKRSRIAKTVLNYKQ